MKKFKIFLGFIIFTLLLFPSNINMVSFATEEAKEVEVTDQEIEKIVDGQLENFEYLELDSFFESENLEIFENKSLKESLKEIITSGSAISLTSLINLVFSSFKFEISNILKLVALIVAIVGFGGFCEALQGFSKKGSGISSAVNFFILTLVLSIVTTIITEFVSDTNTLLLKIKSFMEIIFPILLSLLVTVGGNTSSTTFQPVVVMLTGGVIEVLVYATTTAITLYLVLTVLGELTESIKLDKLKGFISSTFKWIIGLVFTIFMGYLSLSGITAGGSDRISIKTAKYAIRSYIPLVGGYVSDSYEIFRMGSVLIKNSLGMVGVLILFSLVIGKVISLILYNLGFKLASGLTEPMGLSKVTKFLSSLSTIFNFLIAGIVACFLLCFFTILIIMSSANIV